MTDFGNIFSDLKIILLITIGHNIDEALNLIIDIYHNAAACMQVKIANKSEIINKPLWATECLNLNRLKKSHLRLFRNNSTPASLEQYKETRKWFTHLCQCNKNYQEDKGKELEIVLEKNVMKFRFKTCQETTILCDN